MMQSFGICYSPGCYERQPMNDNKIADEAELGMKFDGAGGDHHKEKPVWHLLPWDEVEEIVRVLMFGAKKYTPNNWMHVKPRIRYYDALQRHMKAWLNGEKKDPETGLAHLAHAGCCLLFLMWGDKHHETEDPTAS
jgi:hypothetical protein